MDLSNVKMVVFDMDGVLRFGSKVIPGAQNIFKTLNGTMGFENLSGPVGIAKVAGDSLVSGLIPFLLLLGILSISLGAFNLLPLPMLDGGQFLFILVEKLKGSPISLKLKATLMNLSFILILTLFVFVMMNDIARII